MVEFEVEADPEVVVLSGGDYDVEEGAVPPVELLVLFPVTLPVVEMLLF